MTVQQLIDKLNTIQDKDSIMVMTRGYEGGYDDINDIIPEPIAMAVNVNEDWYYGKHDKVDNLYDATNSDYQVVKAIVL
jgi:hypothetical protein